MSTTPLFDHRPPFDRARLAGSLRKLAAGDIWIGTSSWKYPGWVGQVYTRERYLSRGAFSQRVFEAECLREYAETFPIVCGDFSFYQFPSEQYWRRLFGSTSPALKFAFKVPEQVTARVWPDHQRYGPQAGLVNTSFLDPQSFVEGFLDPLVPYRTQIATLIFEFGTFSRQSYADVREFTRDLDRFFGAVRRPFPYSVEIRNPGFLAPEYFHCLRANGLAHVFNAWTRMPELDRQLRLTEAFTADFTVCRALLRRGRKYEEAVKLLAPYEEIQDQNPEGRRAIRALIEQARANRHAAFIFVNNRFEGNAPRTIEGILEDD